MAASANNARRPVMLAVDGNSLIHRSFHASNGSLERSPEGLANGALKGVWNQLIVAAERLPIAGVRIAFDAPNPARRGDFVEYKSQRAPKPPELVEQLRVSKPHFSSAGFNVVQLEGQEADDVLASTAAMNTAEGWNTIVVSSDRDAFALINENVRVLRVMNGGMASSPLLDAEALVDLCGVRPEHYRLFAALRGDPSDNLAGVNGVGPSGACKIVNGLAELGEPEEVLMSLSTDKAIELFGKSLGTKLTTDEARAISARNVRLMRLRTDLPVGPVSDAAIPLDEAGLLHELHKWGMDSLSARAMSAFCPLRLTVDQMVPTVSLDDLVGLAQVMVDDPDGVEDLVIDLTTPTTEEQVAATPDLLEAESEQLLFF